MKGIADCVPPPVAIGGVGGSGTRLFAEVVRALGVHMGDDLNPSSDNVWFTLLFKRIEILQAGDEEFDRLTQALSSGLQGGAPLDPEIRSLVARCAANDRPPFSKEWLKCRCQSLIRAASAPAHGNRWGWKEPNTHVVIERLWERLPRLKYIHVFRHGLDMAHSDNQSQLEVWGAQVLGAEGPCTPQRSLSYWCWVHRRMRALHSRNRERMHLLDYDAFCACPEQHVAPLLEFLGLPDREIAGLAGMIVAPRPRGPWQPLETFAPEDVAYVRSLGYGVARREPSDREDATTDAAGKALEGPSPGTAAPMIRFMIGGVQKSGTSALASYLSRHPSIDLPRTKEAHVFDSPRFRDTDDAAAIDRVFSPHFAGDAARTVRGDATPVTLMYPGAAERVARYNPEMRWILIFRDPVWRAVSHYHMQRSRGAERFPLLLAVMLEQLRLRGWLRGHRRDMHLRRHSYVLRGRYAAQLDRLAELFPAENILLLRSQDLGADPREVLRRVCRFLGISSMPAEVQFGPVFEGSYKRPPRWSPGVLLLRWLLRNETTELARRHRLQL